MNERRMKNKIGEYADRAHDILDAGGMDAKTRDRLRGVVDELRTIEGGLSDSRLRAAMPTLKLAACGGVFGYLVWHAFNAWGL